MSCRFGGGGGEHPALKQTALLSVERVLSCRSSREAVALRGMCAGRWEPGCAGAVPSPTSRSVVEEEVQGQARKPSWWVRVWEVHGKAQLTLGSGSKTPLVREGGS